MSSLENQISFSTIQTWPKIDLHRHLEGSLRLQTLFDIAQKYPLDIPSRTMNELRPYVQVTSDPANHTAFLSKFEVLRHFYRSPKTIHRMAYEAVADAALDNVKYLELRFSPQALSRVRHFTLTEVTDWVITAVHQASQDYDIQVGLIISLVRHDPLPQAKKVAEVAFERCDKGIVGLDLAGDEVKFPSAPFAPIFKEAKEVGLGITIHAGEWASAYGVREAIEELYADRIGHGIRTMENSHILRLVRERDIALEVCLTSNLQTGVVRQIAHHPLVDMLDLNMKATLNTDDPGVSDCTMSTEYQIALKELGLPYAIIRQMTLNAAQVAFLPEAERTQLVARFERLLPTSIKTLPTP
ncbi:MAG: adenosine deaminase [Chloroflexi bacterium]|nr:adenosine deaminase [Chloroflexota bacterium]